MTQHDGIISYLFGGGAIAVSLADIATISQQIALIIGCLILAIKLVYDAIGLYRRITGKK